MADIAPGLAQSMFAAPSPKRHEAMTCSYWVQCVLLGHFWWWVHEEFQGHFPGHAKGGLAESNEAGSTKNGVRVAPHAAIPGNRHTTLPATAWLLAPPRKPGAIVRRCS